MAITNVPFIQGQNIFATLVTWGADADTTANINHGLIGTPLLVFYSYTATGAAAAAPLVGITAITGTLVTITKTNVSAGSGAAAAGQLIVMRPHSIIQ